MTDTTSNPVEAKRERLAAAFDNDIDPLAEHGPRLSQTGIDLFQMFVEDVLDGKDLTEATRGGYLRTYNEWRDHMEQEGRHPACPTERHIRGYIRHQLEEKGNHPDTVRLKVYHLKSAFEYWQAEPALPHSTDFDPFEQVLQKVDLTADSEPKEPHRMTVDDIAEVLDSVNHIRDLAIITLQLKLGLRATEVCNIRLGDLSLANSEVRDHYEDLGTNSRLGGRENALFVPSDREGNKSRKPRLLPLDDEVRRVLLRYLLIRPDNGEPWLFLSKQGHGKLRKKDINRPWKAAFHPEYAETEEHRAVTSHYGRHRFTTWWRVEQDVSRELVKYMRGDRPGETASKDGIDHYIHTYYEDIEDLYRENIYRFGI